MTYRVLPPAPVDDLASYERTGGGQGYRRALAIGPDAVIDEIQRARLRGRGGGGFPVAAKWRQVREAADRHGEQRFVVANAAEGEPGTYKDRWLVQWAPHAVLEGTLIVMHAVNAQQGVIGVKRRETRVRQRLAAALDEIRAAGWARAEDIDLVDGPDDYLFGEETAMLEVIEGHPPLPRVHRPDQVGLFASWRRTNPTTVGNVETLAHVSRIMAGDLDHFLACGTEDSPGTMLFTVVGDVASPGVWELELGTPLADLLDRAGAGEVLAVFSGASGPVVTPDRFDVPLEFDAMRAAGLELGSGGFVVADPSRCIVQVLATLARFLALESCGQCVACKVGTVEISDRLARIERGAGTPSDIQRIITRARWVTDGSRCRLPRGAQRLVTSALAAFGDRLTAHLGTACPSSRPIQTPLVDGFEDGVVRYEQGYDHDVPAHARRRGMPR